MLKRKAMGLLEDWLRLKTPKQALLVTGARQVGKTYLVREFAKRHYENLAEVNLFENEEAKAALGSATSARELFLRLSAYAEGDLRPGSTLVFIDEVQECPNVVTMIKFLLEREDFDYILSGSMLGVELKCVRSLPVGYLSTVNMFPLDFEEFCWACDIAEDVISEARDAYVERRPVDEFVNRRLLSVLHEYLMVGGMPAAVEAFSRTANMQEVRARQKEIVEWYREDIAKYAGDRALVVKRIFDLIPHELSSQNKRFVAKSIEGKASIERYENDFLWLVDANVALAAYNVSEPRAPLAISMSTKLFKMFLCDVGLLTYQCGMQVVRDMAAGRTDIMYGALYENAVAQELAAHEVPLFYYKNERVGEVDFVLPWALDSVMPVEVKSGKTYKRHSALTKLLKVENYGINRAFVLYEGNVQVDGPVTYLPIYMAMFLGAR